MPVKESIPFSIERIKYPRLLGAHRAGTIRIWEIDTCHLLNEEDEGNLNVEERRRAAKYRSEDERRRFIRTRSALRRIIGYYYNIRPYDAQLSFSSGGKPFVKNNTLGVKFNVSHSGCKALIAVGLMREVGVDIEYRRRRQQIVDDVASYFSANERYLLSRLEGTAKVRLFYRIWCRKEACLKAAGAGLSESLDRFDVIFDRCCGQAQGVAIVSLRQLRWWVTDIEIDPAYAAAVAVEIE
ncbi:MAG: 4'-phosphopantetheinyl transferase superfamily protein [Mesorhizobium sp.]|uniref:4'-phosphopantetheinyl transferase family protein n=1 Tax=Mesorhizobium sp. TaxID=1871066 RepID=UPI00120D4DC8|nr:4'-phosphopantetheinyl transferase superfamily protein [Mesorhizobium sp.]TIR15609.1 MAG: 4'-phosphopantetheinyl transferase superfamily protein [Mesorhizobium sp.]